MTTKTKADLKEDYLRWLEPQLKDEHSTVESYWDLLNLMFETEFFITMPMDNNRVVDGLDLRTEFARAHHIRANVRDSLGKGTFLEVLIGLSRRMEFIAGGQAPGWAWVLLTNLELNRLTDPLSRGKERKARHIMNVVMRRAYAPDGIGGFFPLAWPDDDQTQIELWYQLNTYISELHPEH